ncbi:hypothetical protein E5676_scaffold637G00190 [Cucumis melo var. makuwa]|uniref:Uncharacterized protein n=1 Tax=Cucumis melo var. makuwa TaxID=1194695 RepID=A0A5D3CY14_CUCMM|nr:hypothetical protein E5676_scaffold637G00190 [Cucumis melo var. makuwa]
MGCKQIRLVEAMAPTLEGELKEHEDESDSSKNDHHWKRPLKKANVSGDDPGERDLSVIGVPDSPLNDHLEGLIELGSDESLTEPHAVDSTIGEVGTSKTTVAKPAKQSLRSFTLFEEIHLDKMKVGEKDMESPSSKGDAYPKALLQKVRSTHAPLKIYESPLDTSKRQTTGNPKPSQWVGEKLLSTDKARQLDEKTSIIKEVLTLMDQLQGDAKVIQDRAMQLSLTKKELERRLQSINPKSEQLSILSCEKTEAIDQLKLEVAKLQDEVNTLESTPTITKEVVEALAMVRKSMEDAREEFKNFSGKSVSFSCELISRMPRRDDRSSYYKH